MTTNIPTYTELIESFPDVPTHHEGPPTYLSLKSLRDSLKVNAASVESTLGGGAHGHLGTILPFATYNQIVPPPPGQINSWNDPVFPGATPNIPAGTSTHIAANRRDTFLARTKTWKLNKNVNDALRKLIINSVGDIYLRAIREPHTGYSNIKARTMLSYLFDQYGIISPQDLHDNNTKFYQQWDPSTPFEVLIAQIEDCAEFAQDGQQPFTDQQILNNAYQLVYRSGLYKTWQNYKSHFLQAQREQRLQQNASQQGFYGHLLNDQCTLIKDCIDEHSATQHTALSTLTSDQKTLTNVTNTLATSLQELSKQINDIKQFINNSNSSKENRPNNRSNSRPQTDNGNYCWTHGYRVSKNHTSATCQNPAPGHQKDATRANTMNGST